MQIKLGAPTLSSRVMKQPKSLKELLLLLETELRDSLRDMFHYKLMPGEESPSKIPTSNHLNKTTFLKRKLNLRETKIEEVTIGLEEIIEGEETSETIIITGKTITLEETISEVKDPEITKDLQAKVE